MSQVIRLWSLIYLLFGIYFILLYYFCIDRLTAEQCRILETTERGHNILITGQGGSGKSLGSCAWLTALFLSGGFSRQIVNRVRHRPHFSRSRESYFRVPFLIFVPSQLSESLEQANFIREVLPFAYRLHLPDTVVFVTSTPLCELSSEKRTGRWD